MEPPRAPLILVVDDSPEARELLFEVLLERGYRVDVAGDGREALAGIDRADPPALILLDLQMPVMSGYEVVGVLRADPELRHIPLVICSGEALQMVGAIAADAYLPKPIDLHALLYAVEKRCGPGLTRANAKQAG